MRKLLVLPVLAAAAVAAVLAAPQRVSARPNYHTTMVKVYGDYTGDDAALKKAAEEFKAAATEKRCFVCHDEKEPMGGKKNRSVFAKKLQEELAKAVKAKTPDAADTALVNVKDAEIVTAALTAVGKVKVEEGKDGTYGDLFKAGKLPEPYKAP